MVGPLRLVFCGTPAFAVPTLEALLQAGHRVELVLTQPDRPVGRGLQLAASPVKQFASAQGMPVAQPARLRNNGELEQQLRELQPDAIVVVAYGRILPPWMLGLPPLGCINLHGSLLPKYRGAAPIQWAIAQGEQRTGITTMLLEEGLDTGPMLEQAELTIGAEETAEQLFARMASFGAPYVVSTLAALHAGSLQGRVQPEHGATYAPVLRREDGRADFQLPAQQLFDRWRGFQPWPGLWTSLGGRKLMLRRVAVGRAEPGLAPGMPLVREGALLVGCGGGTTLQLLELQIEGKRSLPAAEFLRGHAAALGGALLG